ncbi:MAG: GNAT family N-acetyltransferase [Prevotella sp.]|nr:GNAT family N-acetyltransferase [Prevotella sp.]
MVTIREVNTKKELKTFARFNYKMYKDNKYAVPELYEDLLDTFNKEKNAAYDFCETALFLAYDDSGEVVGRIAGIINHKANDTWKTKNVRFGWVDFIDDEEVSSALFAKVEEWGRAKGMENIQGPLGFTDMDPEGMLIDGYEEMSTQATIYNYPYYPKHLERLGFEKDADWIEMVINVPDAIPERISRISDIVMKKMGLHIAPRCSTKKFLDKYGMGFFDCVNAAFKPLFGYSELSERQKRSYLDMYSVVLDSELISIVLDKDDNVVAGGVGMPSLSIALQKAKGRMLPFGWYYILKGLKWKHPKVADLMLVAVRPEYQGKGVNAMIINDLIPRFIAGGYEKVETNPELEVNAKVQSQWIYFEREYKKRRRCFTKKI